MSVDGKFHHYEVTGCGETGPDGYRCTRHENGLHVARGLTLDSWAEEWPILEFDSVVLQRLAAQKADNASG